MLPLSSCACLSFFFTHPRTTEIYPLSLHDALPIWKHPVDHARGEDRQWLALSARDGRPVPVGPGGEPWASRHEPAEGGDRKSTRLNSSHRCISYAVFCLKKKKRRNTYTE